MDGVNTVDNSCGVTGDVAVRLVDGTLSPMVNLAGPQGAGLLSFAQGLGVHMQHACNIEAGDTASTLYSVTLPGQAPLTVGAATQFLMSDGSYKRADALAVNDVLVGRFAPITLAAAPVASTPDTPAQLYSLSVHGVGNFALAAGPFVKSQNANWV